ncbi:hypothetical protein [Flavobacterium lindanitolerans]|uniref:hypothetical protein n=1 Tax=Flavobacterium lindanitolerans TaxID=428988 RepID=UPI0027BAECE1|nr:hypothetical protein [Flavobacterium lindanitolerans]
MKLSKFLNLGILFCTITAFSQNVASTATLTSGGLNAGTDGTANTFYGYQTGRYTGTGINNTFIGHESGRENTTGKNNAFIGYQAGANNTIGANNTFVGSHSGQTSYSGSYNVYLGQFAGGENNGNYNTFLGMQAGGDSQGSNNVLIGSNAGYSMSGNDKLFIDNTDTASPLIWGDFAQDQLKFNGKVGIGYGFGNFPTTAGSVNVSNYNLFVKGGILTEEVRVNLQSAWADYVFDENYKLKSLKEVETFIKENGHLENVPSAKQVKEEGIELGEMVKIQQEKIEELTLYIIEQNKINESQNKELQELKEILKSIIK